MAPPKLLLEDFKKLAISRGGLCLSDTYINGHTKLKWQCSLLHTWEATGSHVKEGSWCLSCSSSLGERLTRYVFEKLFNNTFIKCRPKWLKSKRYLELDGYCEQLNMAFEYNGLQHYTNTLYSSNGKLLTISNNDELKSNLCKKYKVNLFVIKQPKLKITIDYIKQEIKNECLRLNVKIPDNFDNIKLDINEVYKIPSNFIFLKEIQDIAINKNGKCLSSIYLSAKHKLQFYCNKCAHIWGARPPNIKRGSWCPKCSKQFLTIEDAQNLAKLNNGKCLSITYINSKTPMIWECSNKHVWKATTHQVNGGKWCAECVKIKCKLRRVSIDIYKNIAINKNGECLSNEVFSCRDYLTWKCEFGHVWEAQAYCIKNSSQWCPTCALKKRIAVLKGLNEKQA